MINRRSGDWGRIIVRRVSKKPKLDMYARDVESAIAWILKTRKSRHHHWIERLGYTATPTKK